MQQRRWSFTESIVNVGIGYFVAVASQIIVFPFFGLKCDLRDNLMIGLVFTVISIARSYFLRRVFNRFTDKPLHARDIKGDV